MLRALLFILPLALTIYAFIDCLNTPEDEVKHLPKVAWVFIILLFWVVGPIVWLAAGKNRHPVRGGGAAGGYRGRRAQQWVAPDDNPEFLRSIKDEQKKDAPPSPDAAEKDEKQRDEPRGDGEPGPGPGGPEDSPK
ncbi:PLD nuclease N-terminal domain-containing protein [Streptomyces sp. NPDC091272]|uniref:PLD nuclease N-terminal domain-containing protein n=1 Tax=Streptomyces sp. NPDC091272 TaxID=3365981 RepID=UPI0037F1BFF3